MKSITKRAISALSATSVVAVAAAYKIPEQSINSMSLGGAYVAHTNGADSAYYNPAAMIFLPDKRFVEGGLTLAHLPSITYRSNPQFNGETKVENIPIPFLHYVSKSMGDFRWGFSITSPAGLKKRWDTPFQKLFAQEFSLENIELSPSFGYKISDNLAIGGGIRLLYSRGKVYSDGGAIAPIKRQMKGDTTEFGYNLALLFKPTDEINLAATYRSNINIKEKGKANLFFFGAAKQYGADVTVPLPAALNLAISKSWNNRFTLEFNYERTYWSKYKNLDFNYDEAVQNPFLLSAFDAPLPRDWKDTDTFRIGATYKLNESFTAMAAFAIDETPVPSRTIGFELPDSDAKIVSAGFRYKQSENLSFGAAVLYDIKKSRTIAPNVAENSIIKNGGTFDDGGALLFTVGVTYEY